MARENKLMAGPEMDRLVSIVTSKSLQPYSTNAVSAFILLNDKMSSTAASFSVNFNKQLNSQQCTVAINGKEFVGGYFPHCVSVIILREFIGTLSQGNELDTPKKIRKWYLSDDSVVPYYKEELDILESLSDKDLKQLLEL